MEIRMPLTLVTQANLTDCGLACTAIVARQKLETVLRVAIKECGYPKDGPHTTTDEKKPVRRFDGHGRRSSRLNVLQPWSMPPAVQLA
jgi:hypothetical protein